MEEMAPVSQSRLIDLVRLSIRNGTTHVLPVVIDQWTTSACVEIVRLREALDAIAEAPIVRLGETIEEFKERYSAWYRQMKEVRAKLEG